MAEVGNLTATLTLETDGFQQGISDATKQTNVFADVLSANLTTKAIGMAIDGLKKLADVAADTFKEAVKGFADYEQLAGGVKKLYGEAADEVIKNAERAYESVGISTNEYMQSVTSFSAALINSVGQVAQTDLKALEGTLAEEYKETKRYLEDQYEIEKDYWNKKINAATDTGYKEKLKAQRDEDLKELKRANEDQLEALKQHNKDALAEAERLNKQTVTTTESLQRSAEVADMIMQDIADNANTFGTYTVSELQNVYQALAKGMYTTLDNLSLGFKGTQQGVQDLIDRANELRGSNDLTIDSFEDIAVAIHTVQEEMHITGTTSNEASSTVTGSVNAMKAAWHNLVAGLGNDKADLDKLINDFFEKANNVWNNLQPVAERVLENMIDVAIKAMPKFVDLGLKIGAAILEGLAKALAKLVLSPVAQLLKVTGIADLTGLNQNSGYTYYRASGGPVQAGVPYMTGELGPELFIPSTNGYILNNEDTQDYLSGSGITININGDVYDDERSMRSKMQSAVLGILQEQIAYA